MLDENDADAQKVCCQDSMMCDEFYMYRPSDTCSRYAGAHAGEMCDTFYIYIYSICTLLVPCICIMCSRYAGTNSGE